MGVKVLGYIAIVLAALAIGMVASFLASSGYARGYSAGGDAGYKAGLASGHSATCNDLSNWARWATNVNNAELTSRHYDAITGFQVSSTIDAAGHYVCQTSGPHLVNNPYEPPRPSAAP